MDLLAAFCWQRKGWIMPKTHENTHTHSINDALRDYATAVGDWKRQRIANLLHGWAERFEQEFNLGIETPAIKIDRIRRDFGTCRFGRNGFGLNWEVRQLFCRSTAGMQKVLSESSQLKK